MNHDSVKRSQPVWLTQRLTGLANRVRLIQKVGQPIRSTHIKVNPFGQPKKRSTHSVIPKNGQPFRSTQIKAE